MVNNGTVRLAPTTNIREAWRTNPVFSISGRRRISCSIIERIMTASPMPFTFTIRRRRRPEIEIGVLVGRGTKEVMTIGADFRMHEFGGFKELARLLKMLLDIRRSRYQAILNFEQNFPRVNLALMTAGSRVRIGF